MNFNLVHEENDDNGNFKAIDMEKIDLEQNNKNYQSFDEKDSNTNFTSKNSIVPEVPNKEDTNKDKETEEQRISYNTLHEPIQMTLVCFIFNIASRFKQDWL